MRYEYDDKARWELIRRDDVLVPRNEQPIVLDLAQAVAWVEENRPIPWIGSAISVPAPSALPSGAAISKALFGALCPSLRDQWDSLQDSFLSLWPLERLFDATDLLGGNLKEAVLEWFAQAEKLRKPNALHHAIAEYVRRFDINECVTTNWDSLIEGAVRHTGRSSRSVGVDGGIEASKTRDLEHELRVYHPHGSFAQSDVVCSHFIQARGVPIWPARQGRKFLFLGYSGYEPSMYPHLEGIGSIGALWCVRSMDDLHTRMKHRLLTLRNALVYVGDLRELLRAVGVLHSDISFQSGPWDCRLETPNGDGAAMDGVLRMSMGRMTLAEAFAWVGKAETAGGFVLRLQFLSDHVGRLVLSGCQDSDIERVITSVISNAPPIASELHCVDQYWLWYVAHMVRMSGCVSREALEHLERISTRADLAERAGAQGLCTLLQAKAYASVLVHGAGDILPEGQYVMAGALGNKLLVGECAELFGWQALWRGEADKARALFDAAATHFYVSFAPEAGDRMLRLASQVGLRRRVAFPAMTL